MAENLDPINIDINFNQNVSEEAPKATRANEEMTRSVVALEQEIARLSKVASDMSVALEEQKKMAAGASGEYDHIRKSIEATESALASARNELQEYSRMQEQLNRASGEGVDIADALAGVRGRLADTEQSLVEAAGELVANQQDINNSMDEGGQSASQYSMSTRILGEALKQVARGLGIENTQILRTIGNVRLLTTVKQGWNSAAQVLNRTLGLSTLACKALMATGIGLVIAGVAAAVSVYKEWSKSQDDNIQKLEEQRRLNDLYSSSIGGQLVQFERLRQEWIAAGSDLAKKEELVRKNSSAYNELGVEVRNVSDAETMFIDNAPAFIESIKQRAMAAAMMDLAAEQYKEAVKKMMDAESRRSDPTFMDKLKANFRGDQKLNPLSLLGGAIFGKKSAGEIANEAANEIITKEKETIASIPDKIAEALAMDKTAIDKIKETGLEASGEIKAFSKKYYEDIVSHNKKILAGMTKDELQSAEGKAARKAVEDAQKSLESWKIDGTSGKSKSGADKKQKTKDKQALQAIRAAEDLEMRIYEAEIAAMDEGSAKLLAQMELDHKKQMQALERQQEDALRTKRDNARALFESDPNNKGKTFDDSAIQLSEEELRQYQALQSKLTENYEQEKFNTELQYMRDYIREYGTFQQQKLAIAQEYDKKIAASGNEWEKKSLEARKQAALSAVDFDAINKRIDWQAVFGSMTGMLDGQLKELLANLKEYVGTDEFKASGDTDKKTIYEAIDRLKAASPEGQGTLNFGEIRKQMDELGAAINELQTATLRQKTALDNQDRAQKDYTAALATGNEAIIESARQALAGADATAAAAVETYKSAEANVEGLGRSFREKAGDTIDGLNLVADGLHNFATGTLPSIFSGLQSTLAGLSKLDIGGEVGKAIGSLSETLESTGVVGQIISAVLSILDILKDGIGSLVANIIDTVFNAIDGILKDILSGQIVIEIGNSLKEGFRNILNTISFGGFNSLISSINGGNAKETAATISRLTSSNEALKVSVDALKDEISGANGAKSIQAYIEALEVQKRYEKNLQDILGAQMNYANSHHSNAYYWSLDPGSLKDVNKLLNTTLKNTWEDFSGLTADQMNEIRKHLPDVWSEMINQGKYGDRFKDDWNNYADQAGKAVELSEELRENIAQISFASLRDSFVNALMDMDADAQTFAGNFEEYMTKALLNFAIGDLLDEGLENWYKSWTQDMQDQNGKLTDAQIEQYRKEWDEMVQQGLSLRDQIASQTGYTGDEADSPRTGTKGVAASASQDSINELNGGIYALRQQVGDIRNLEKESALILRTQQASLNRIAENTEYCRLLENVKNSLEDIQQRGIKVKV